MAQVKGNYETIMVFSTANGEEAVTALVEKFKGMIEANATIESEDTWGKRRLAYPINDELEGFYYMVNFSCTPDFPAELERVFNITDGILRTIVIAKEEK